MCYFNPRSREGSDHSWGMTMPSVRHFNPRSREGSDLDILVYTGIKPDFNPRSREGSDDIDVPLPMTGDEFQSTLP